MNIRTLRVLALILLGLGLTAVLGVGALLSWRQGAPPEPGVSYGPPPWMPLAADKSLGVNTDLSRLDAQGREDALTAMEVAGFRWLRQRFAWDAIEPVKGEYEWGIWDEIVRDVTRHNIRLIAVLDGSPTWARAEEDAANPLAPPLDPKDYGAFVAALTGRYRDWIQYYQIWDEPNIAPHWGARAIDPAAYARLLREGAIQVRTADPDAVILLAALAPNIEPGGSNMSDLLFLEALYEQRAAEWFDVVAAQPYGFDQPARARPEADRLSWRRSALLRQVMEAHDDAATPVWAVSFGWHNRDTEEIMDLVQQARQDWPWLGPMIWAAWSPQDVHGQYALTDALGRTNGVYRALQVWAAAAAVAWPGSYPANHPSGHYEGDWRVTSLGADIGRSGDRMTISFWGTRLDLTVRRGDYRAFLFVTVDGQPANALPRDAEGRSYVVLYDPEHETDTVTLARSLPEGTHTAELVAERGWGQWAIVGWTVSRELPAHSSGLALSLGLGAFVVMASTVVLSWMYRRSWLVVVDRLLRRVGSLDDRWTLGLVAGVALWLYFVTGDLPSLIALTLLAFLLLLRPEAGLPLIALALPFYQPGKPLLGKVFSMVEILTVLTAAAWAVQWGLRRIGLGLPARRSEKSRMTTLDWGIVALLLVSTASLTWAAHFRVAAREYRTVVLEAVAFYGLLRAMLDERRDIWRVADAWMLGGVLIALVGCLQWALGENLISAEGVWRVRGFYGSPNNLALYLGRVFPLTLAVAVWGRDGLRRWACGLAAVIIAAALFLTYSRGAWLLGVPASLLFLAAMRGRRSFLITVGGLTAFLTMAILVVGIGRLTSLFDTGQGTTFFRLQLWQSSWKMIQDHPLLGVGLDNFLYQYRTYYVLPTAWEEFNLSHPHNLVLDFWLRLGLPGLGLLVWLLVAFFRQSGRVYRSLPEGNDRILILGLMGGMVNGVAHGLVDHSFFLVDLAFVWMIILALMQGMAKRQLNSHS